MLDGIRRIYRTLIAQRPDDGVGRFRNPLMIPNVCFRGVKRTWVGALQMSAFDPKRTI